jgi:hypothetical protein
MSIMQMVFAHPLENISAKVTCSRLQQSLEQLTPEQVASLTSYD